MQVLVQAACVRHPWWRTEAKLAIVFIYFLVHILDFPEGISKKKCNFFSFLIFTSSVQSWSLDQPLVPGVLVNKTFTQKISISSNPNIVYVLKILSEEELLHF